MDFYPCKLIIKKLILLLLFIPLVSFGQDGLGETIYDKLPETLYVSGIKIQDIPTKYMTMTLGTTLGAKLVGGNNFGNYFITLEWGQALLKKPNTKNKYYSHSSAVVTQQVPTENTRVFISTDLLLSKTTLPFKLFASLISSGPGANKIGYLFLKSCFKRNIKSLK